MKNEAKEHSESPTATPEQRSVIGRTIRFCMENRLVVVLFLLGIVLAGILVAPFDWEIGNIQRYPIPVDAIHQFLTRGGILTKEEYDEAPYIVAFQDDRIVAATTDTAYVRGLDEKIATNLYSIVRLGKAYRDPENGNEIIGCSTCEPGILGFAM